mmetsp:Transcript_15288/g.26725  ORF Transcript_15288/g.26725 Transcript_15288/m.26725 type:complete len:177 (-) Transcript_15288:575-1105(-)
MNIPELHHKVDPRAKEIQDACEKLGIRMQPAMVPFLECINEMMDLLTLYSRDAPDPKPIPSVNDEEFETYVGPLMENIETLCDIKDGVSHDDLLEYHLLCLGEASFVFAWMYSPDPVQHIESIQNSLLQPIVEQLEKKSVDSDEVHANLAHAVASIVTDIKQFVQDNYREGMFTSA